MYEIYTDVGDFIAVYGKTKHEVTGESMLDALMHLELDLSEREEEAMNAAKPKLPSLHPVPHL